ncbi:MAG: hypothetical protein ACE5KT_00785 [Methanosarcinales archaeon]
MVWVPLFKFDEKIYEGSDCRFKTEDIEHKHFTLIVEDNETNELGFLEDTCWEILKDWQRSGNLQSYLKDFKSLKNKFAVEVISKGMHQEERVLNQEYKEYVEMELDYISEGCEKYWKEYKKKTKFEIHELDDKRDLYLHIEWANGRKADIIHSIYGSLTSKIPEELRRVGGQYHRRAFFNTRIIPDGKLKQVYSHQNEKGEIIISRHAKPVPERVLKAHSELIFGIRDFVIGMYNSIKTF